MKEEDDNKIVKEVLVNVTKFINNWKNNKSIEGVATAEERIFNLSITHVEE